MMNRIPGSSLISSPSSSYGTSSSITPSLGSTEFQPPFFKLVKRSKWPKLVLMLKDKRNHEMCKECDETGLTLLGVSLGFHAPIEIIKLIVSIDPSQLTSVDMFGANPLHQACLNGNPPTIISYIIEQRGDLVSSRDKDNRTPLHQITECICRDEIHLKEGLQVIEILCRYNCTMIHTQDNFRNSPLDVVHSATCARDISPSEEKRLSKTAKFLRKISFQVYQLKKKCWEDKIPLEIGQISSSKISILTGSTKSLSLQSQSHENSESMGRFLRGDEW